MSDIFIVDDGDSNIKQAPEKQEKHPSKEGNLLDRINEYLLASQKVKTKDKVVFYRMLATMVNSWISLLKAIWILEEQETNLVLKRVLGELKMSLKSWKNLSESMAVFSDSFDDAEIGIIESWEKTWKLNYALLTLADQVEKVESMTWKIKWALIYPWMIITVVFWVLMVLMIFVVPGLLEIFEDKSKLPTSTKILIWMSEVFQNYWWLMLISIFISILGLNIWKKTPAGRYWWDAFMLKTPVFWDIIRKVILAKFSRVLSWLLWSWVSIVESLRITSSALWNEVYRERILLLREDVKKWLKIWEWLDWDPLFPIMLIQMIQVWEQTAQVDKIIIKIADFYDEEVNNKVSIINKLLEPFIIVFMAVVVWFIAIAIMQPVMNLAEQFSDK